MVKLTSVPINIQQYCYLKPSSFSLQYPCTKTQSSSLWVPVPYAFLQMPGGFSVHCRKT